MAVAARDCSRHLQVYFFLVQISCSLNGPYCLFALFCLVRDTDSILYGYLKQNLSSEERKKILLDVADALEANEDLIRSENEADLAAAHEAGYESALVSRLTLKPGKVGSWIVLLVRTKLIC